MSLGAGKTSYHKFEASCPMELVQGAARDGIWLPKLPALSRWARPTFLPGSKITRGEFSMPNISGTKSFPGWKRPLRRWSSAGGYRRSAIWITGTCISLIIRHGLAGLDTNRYLPIYLRGNISREGELVKALLRGIKIEPPHSLGKVKPVYFTAVEENSRKPVAVLYDAQDIAEAALISIKALTNFDSDSQNCITFILIGQPELRVLLGYSHFDSLRARIRLSHHLLPMGIEETASYIDH